ncbi:MAG: hypothetical protein ACRDHL_04675 [Candidatus Promineifilaceae bacterium]
MESRLSRWCEGIIEAGWLAAIIATPLFFNIHSSRVFEPDKLTLLRSIALLMAAAWLVRFVEMRAWRDLSWLKWRAPNPIWRLPFVIPVALLAAVYLVSTLFSVTRTVSWAGSYQRLQGTYTTLAYLVIFALMAVTIRSREQVRRAITVAILISIPVSLYAILQHFDLDPLPWGGDVQRRVAGHMGNSIFVAAYLIMIIPLTLARIIDAFTNILGDEEMYVSDVLRSSIYVFTLAIQFVAVYWTRSRGPIIGLAVGLYAFMLIMLVTLRNAAPGGRRFSGRDALKSLAIVAAGALLPFALAVTVLAGRVEPLAAFGFFAGSVALLVVLILALAIARRGWRWLWLSWIVLAVTLAGLLGLLNVPEEAAGAVANVPVVGDGLEAMAEWRQLPEIGRFGRLLESEEGTGRVRVLIWEGALELLGPHQPLEDPFGRADPFSFLRPVIGYGPESMYVAYNRFYPPELATIEARNATPDRSHNETFDALVITGVAGLLVWQLLFLSVFYYGFRWLGVVRSRRDRNALIGLWIGGAAVAGLALTAWLGTSFLGVALPFGSILGLVIYLIYYAITTQGDAAEVGDAFGVDRLLMIALLAAIMAHYVEILFGIAVAATRTHFFVYLALLFLVGYWLPRTREAPAAPAVVDRRGRRRRAAPAPAAESGWRAALGSNALLLGMVIGSLAYNFMTFSLPAGQTIQSIADVPGVTQIFRHSFFVNAKNNFTPSPFVFLVLILTWLLGSLVILAEVARHSPLRLTLPAGQARPERERVAALILALAGLAGLALASLTARGDEAGRNGAVALVAAVAWAGLCAYAVFGLLGGRPNGRPASGAVALVGLAAAMPLVAAGQIRAGLGLAAACSVVIYLLWDRSWNESLLPAAVLAVASLAIGLGYALFHALVIRSTMLAPAGVTGATELAVRRVLESNQVTSLLTVFYLFFFAVLLAAGWVLARPKAARTRQTGTSAGLAAGALLGALTIFLIATTNLRIVHADMVYKRADPWDKQATQTRNPELWDVAIAIYERAADLAPSEDFYYLWLGRAYLERSALAENPQEREQLLETASARLAEAQRINPLNTDHTANLARLNTRWAEGAEAEARETRIRQATAYYQDAISLSPNNGIIRNEYARLAYLLQNDCDEALQRYRESLAVDPFFTTTYFERAEIAKACADEAEGAAAQAYYQEALESVRGGLEREDEPPGRWVLLAQIHIGLNQPQAAQEAYQEAMARAGGNVAAWQIDFSMAQAYSNNGDASQAREYAARALQTAPQDVAAQIQAFIDGLGAES